MFIFFIKIEKKKKKNREIYNSQTFHFEAQAVVEKWNLCNNAGDTT